MQNETLQDFLDKVGSKLKDISFKSEKERMAIVYNMAGITLMKRGFEKVGLNFQETMGIETKKVIRILRQRPTLEEKFGDLKGDKKLYRYLEIMSEMASKGLLISREDFADVFDKSGDYLLRLNYSSFYGDFMNYCVEQDVEKNILSIDEFRLLLRTSSCCKSFNKPVWFKVKGDRQKRGKTYRAAVFYIIDLKAKQVNLDGFL